MSANLRGPRSAVLVVAVAVGIAAGLWGCTCGSPPVLAEPCRGVAGAQPDRTATCSADAECADHHACRAVEGLNGGRCCVFENRACATEADCCPGQTCPATRLRCLDQSDSCAVDADCGALKDRFCEAYTDAYGTSRRCRLRACGAQGACPDGQSCFQGECLAELPCGGRCDPGTACVPTLGRCQEFAHPTGREAAGCPLSCAPGFIATFTDGRNLWDACSLPDVACRCAELPALRSFDLGRFSALAAEPGRGLHVSEYDGQFGDLVVASYGLDGALVGARWVDGLPLDAGVIYGPSGPRGGVEVPGPDVGRYSDLVASGGRLYVSYYDVTHGDLKVAVRGADGAWATHVVDGAGAGNGAGADVGLYSSIAVDSGGRPAVAYFQRAADAATALEACPGASARPVPPGWSPRSSSRAP